MRDPIHSQTPAKGPSSDLFVLKLEKFYPNNKLSYIHFPIMPR